MALFDNIREESSFFKVEFEAWQSILKKWYIFKIEMKTCELTFKNCIFLKVDI